jgi:hypothetical protein
MTLEPPPSSADQGTAKVLRQESVGTAGAKEARRLRALQFHVQQESERVFRDKVLAASSRLKWGWHADLTVFFSTSVFLVLGTTCY